MSRQASTVKALLQAINQRQPSEALLVAMFHELAGEIQQAATLAGQEGSRIDLLPFEPSTESGVGNKEIVLLLKPELTNSGELTKMGIEPSVIPPLSTLLQRTLIYISTLDLSICGISIVGWKHTRQNHVVARQFISIDRVAHHGCVFRSKVATDSGRNLPPIPVEGCH